MAEQTDGFSVQAQWLLNPGTLPLPVNQYYIQAGPNVDGETEPDSFIITFGNTVPPMVAPDTPPEVIATMNSLVVPAQPLFFTTQRLRELHRKLGEVVEALDAHAAGN